MQYKIECTEVKNTHTNTFKFFVFVFCICDKLNFLNYIKRTIFDKIFPFFYFKIEKYQLLVI